MKIERPAHFGGKIYGQKNTQTFTENGKIHGNLTELSLIHGLTT